MSIRELLSKDPDEVLYGKHSRVFVFRNRGLALKIFKPELKSSFLKEVTALRKIGQTFPDIAPRLIDYDEEVKGVLMEYLEGTPLVDLPNSKIEANLRKIIRVPILLDYLRIQKEEMSRPYKHFIVTSLKPFNLKVIDFDRSTYPGRPTNFPGFLLFLRRSLKLKFDEGEMANLGKLYKSRLKMAWESRGGLALENLIDEFYLDLIERLKEA